MARPFLIFFPVFFFLFFFLFFLLFFLLLRFRLLLSFCRLLCFCRLLPFDLEVTGVELLPNGIQATAVGSNVPIVGSTPQE